MADTIIGNTQTTATKQAAIAAMAQKELKASSIFASYFMDVSKFAVKGVKSISFPALTSFTAAERSSGGTLDAQALTSSVDTLLLNIPAYIKWIIDPNDAIQSTLDWELETVSRAASAHGRYFDAKVLASVVADAGECSGSAVAITRNLVLEMRQYLKKNEADMSKVRLFVAADQMTALLKIDEFTRVDAFGSDVLASGLIGKVYGIPVIEHNLLADGFYFMAEEGAIAYGFQKSPAIGEQDDIDHGVGAKKKAMDCLYGVKSLQIGQANASVGKSALMIRCSDGV